MAKLLTLIQNKTMTTPQKEFVWPTIPDQLPAPWWSRSPKHWLEHQKDLIKFCRCCEEDLGLTAELPVEVPGRNHDGGVDLYIYVNGKKLGLDLKTFGLGLSESGATYSWLSDYHKARPWAAFYEGRKTDFYIHSDPKSPVSQWLTGIELEKSKFPGGRHFYWTNNVRTFSDYLLKQCAS